AEVVLAAGVDQRTEDRLDAVLLAVRSEEVGDLHLQRLGDPGQRLEVRRPLAALDHREERHADVGALAEVFLRHAGDAAGAELADPSSDLFDATALRHLGPRVSRLGCASVPGGARASQISVTADGL